MALLILPAALDSPRTIQVGRQGLCVLHPLCDNAGSGLSFTGSTYRRVRVIGCCVAVAAWRKTPSRKNPTWRTEEDLQQLLERLEQPPKPDRLPDLRKRHKKVVGLGSGPSAEVVEALVDEVVPERRGNRPDTFDPREDDPLGKGIDLMLTPGNSFEKMICCMGCGVPLQTHDPNNVGFVPMFEYLTKWERKERRKILCSRCKELDRGMLRPVIQETFGSNPASAEQPGFGDRVVPADVLTRQLRMIRLRRCLVVYVLDILDFNGSFLRNLREIVGRNPLLVVATKTDLLPPQTDFNKVREWLRFALKKKRLRTLDVTMVSNLTGKGVSQTTDILLELRRGLDVFVVGTANAGKSMFIGQLLEQLEQRFPEGKVEDCESPLVSATPGTTLGIIPLRAFRRSGTSPVFSCLYDTPGVHQPHSLQNLIHIDQYNQVQPTRPFGVRNLNPAKDAIATLALSGVPVTSESVSERLRQPVRYTWGFPGAAPVAVVEVAPPVLPLLSLSFVGVENLAVNCQQELPNETAGDDEKDSFLPEGLTLAQIAYVKLPPELTLEGQVLMDICLAGFGWVAVTAKAVSKKAVGRSLERATVAVRIYAPKHLKIKLGRFPMPVAGLPGEVADLPQEEDPSELRSEVGEVRQPLRERSLFRDDRSLDRDRDDEVSDGTEDQDDDPTLRRPQWSPGVMPSSTEWLGPGASEEEMLGDLFPGAMPRGREKNSTHSAAQGRQEGRTRGPRWAAGDGEHRPPRPSGGEDRPRRGRGMPRERRWARHSSEPSEAPRDQRDGRGNSAPSPSRRQQGRSSSSEDFRRHSPAEASGPGLGSAPAHWRSRPARARAGPGWSEDAQEPWDQASSRRPGQGQRPRSRAGAGSGKGAEPRPEPVQRPKSPRAPPGRSPASTGRGGAGAQAGLVRRLRR